MRRYLIMGFILVVTLSLTILITQGVEKTVTLDINGESKKVKTSAWTVTRFLGEQGIHLTEQDSIESPNSSLLIGDDELSIQQASWLTISGDGDIQAYYGHYEKIEDVVMNSGIEITPGDLLYLDGELAGMEAGIQPGKNHSLQIHKSRQVDFHQGNTSSSFHTSAPTIGSALWSQDIVLDNGDRLEPSLDSPITGMDEVELVDSQEITIQLANETLVSKTSASTIGEALSEAGIALQGLDYSSPGVNDPVPENGQIQVIRVREEQFLESEPIPFETESQPVADLEIDNRSLVQPGIFGLNTKRVRVRYEDDQEISRQVEDEYVSQPPQTEIIGYGTKIVPRTLDTPGGQITYWRALEMYAVSYNVTSNGGYGTATGVPLAKGVAAIDPRYIPYGTRMYVPGYGEALAADTGGGINGRMIDLGYLDEDYVSWHQWVTVYFLWPPPETVAWIIP